MLSLSTLGKGALRYYLEYASELSEGQGRRLGQETEQRPLEDPGPSLTSSDENLPFERISPQRQPLTAGE